MLLPHLASRLYGTPLLVACSKLDIILAVLGDRIGWPEPQSALPTLAPRAVPDVRYDEHAGIAVIPVYGTLVRRSLGLDAASGLTSYGEINALLDAAIADPSISGILLDVDSPGGEAGGVFELAQRVRAADAVKPVWAIASDSAFSAAYAIACAASRLYVTQTAGVGSIGVIAMHVDQSVRDAQEGYRYTAITAGEQKNDFSPHEKLTSEAHARLQAEVDRLYGIFVEHVSSMRHLDARFVRSTQAGLYFGPEAMAAGLADAQGSLDDALNEFTSTLATHRARGHPAAVSQSPVLSHPLLLEQPLMTEGTITDINPEPAGIPADPAPEPPNSPEPLTPPDEDAIQSAIAATRADAVAIAELCQLAGHPQRIAAFLAEGASEAQVRHALLATRAESPEILSMIHPEATATTESPEQNPLIKAVKKLSGKA